ncbi:hypothetical protein ACIPYQ_05605 [Streptomyces sp. NPDC090045]|uniref:hypothetical protein n=1 Tax=Streptomyces sp. NPDC090045 TaxID=3365927 RepID=UPI00380B5258
MGTIRKISCSVLVAAALSGCSVLPGSGSESGPKKGDESGLTYQDALEAMLPGVRDAMKPAMPGVEPQEGLRSNADCGGPDLLDGKDASKVKSTFDVDLTGVAPDGRSPEELASGVVSRLVSQGEWKAGQRQDTTPVSKPDGVIKYVDKPGAGSVMVIAYPFKTTSGAVIPKLSAVIVTDCLRNPKYMKE